MLDRREIRENPDAVKDAVRKKGISLDVDELLDLDRAARKLQHELDQAQARRKSSAKEFAQADDARRAQLRAQHAELEAQLKELREQLAETTEKLNGLMLLTPTIPWEGAPVGPDESANVVIRTVGTPPEFDFKPLDHVELLEKRGWADFTRARKVAGERAYALAGELVLLERAVHSYALDVLAGKDFTVISVPSLVREGPLTGTGMFPAHREETYAIPADDLYLAGTAEVALVGFHSDEILDFKRLPVRYAGISPCFRREAGSAGRDVRGLLRVHQFEKVEQFVICAADADESDRWHAQLLGTAEQLLQGLGLAYHLDAVAGRVPRDAQLLVAARLAGPAGQPALPRHRRHGAVRLHPEQHRGGHAAAAGGAGGELPDQRRAGTGARGAAALPGRPRAALSRVVTRALMSALSQNHLGLVALVASCVAGRRTR